MNYRKIFGFLLDCFFPPRCAFCDKVKDLTNGICADCVADIHLISPPYCVHCGCNKQDCTCGGSQMFFSELAAPFYYEGSVTRGIQLFKFNGNPGASAVFAEWMTNEAKKRFANCDFDLVIGVPMRKKDRRARGYNQSLLLAEKIAKALSVKYDGELMKKIYETPKQHTLSARSRKGNLSGVFEVTRPEAVKDKHILLVDDVSTTGETLRECAKMLYLYDAADVRCLVIAKARRKRKGGEEQCSV